MIADFQTLAEKIQRLAELAQALRSENAELRLRSTALAAENAELAQRMREAHARVAALLERMPAPEREKQNEAAA